MKLPDFSRGSLVGRLIWLAAGWSLAVLAVAGVSLSTFFHQAAQHRFDQGVAELIDNLFAGASVDDRGRVLAPPNTDARAARALSGKYWSIDEVSGGRLVELVRSRSLWDADPLPGPPGGLAVLNQSAGKTLAYNAPGPAGQPLRLAAMQARLPGREAPVVFLAAEDRSPLERDARRFAEMTALALVLLGAGIVGAVFVQVRVGLHPLFRLSREVSDLRRGRAERVEGRYPTELEPLAEELNALVAHNQEVVERQRTHVGNLAHALKTPLSVMLSEAGRAETALAETVRRQADAMRTQVDHHLRRARTAARAQGSRDRTDVSAALEELARTLERIFRERQVEIDWRAPEGLAFQGERQDFLEIAGNVLENACKWCSHEVWARAEPISPTRLRLTVEDDGPGLPPERLQEVLRRGARLDESAPGSGLGLSIVDELARAYGGAITLGPSTHGGLKAEIELPRG